MNNAWKDFHKQIKLSAYVCIQFIFHEPAFKKKKFVLDKFYDLNYNQNFYFMALKCPQ